MALVLVVMVRLYTVVPGKTPCLHCLLKVMPHTGMTCDTVGIISPAVQIVAAIKWLRFSSRLLEMTKPYEKLLNV